MKKTIYSAISLLMTMVIALCLVSCTSNDNPWDFATYTEDTTFGNGSKTVVVEVTVLEQKVTFTINTDEDTVGAALSEHNLISGEEGQYGLYVKKVNGITADYDIDQSYWAFYVNDEYAMSGIELTEISEDATYQLVYTK